MNFSKLKLIYHTVKHLRFKQVYYRIYYTLRNKFFKKEYSKILNKEIQPLVWKNTIEYNTSYLGDNRFKFLNIEHDFKSQIDWNYNAYGKLWTYNLNYFDFLNQESFSVENGLKLIKIYSKQDNQLKDGKEPYPISLRVINWIKFLSENKISDSRINQTIYNHFQVLLHNLEYHLLGNHLLENAFALFFGGIYFNDKILADKAEKLLYSELEEQLFEDGAHFELSPMYHQILLHRLLDCISLVQQNSGKVNANLKRFLQEKAVKMLSWLQTIVFTNGDIPMVNDSAYGISLQATQLFEYADQLQLKWNKVRLQSSGYRKYSDENLEAFVDVGPLAIDYQPGHAHADTFNFILYAKGKPVLVDPAVSTYEINDTRKRERATSSHNTITVNDKNSSQVWSGFRVAKRAEVTILQDELTKVVAAHNGFRDCKHKRLFSLENNTFIIEDEVAGGNELKAHFHFAPNCEIEVIDNKKLLVDAVEIQFFEHQKLEIQEYYFAKGYNTTIIAKKVVVLFTEKLRTEIKVIA